jgi:hypothetical protein
MVLLLTGLLLGAGVAASEDMAPPVISLDLGTMAGIVPRAAAGNTLCYSRLETQSFRQADDPEWTESQCLVENLETHQGGMIKARKCAVPCLKTLRVYYNFKFAQRGGSCNFRPVRLGLVSAVHMPAII